MTRSPTPPCDRATTAASSPTSSTSHETHPTITLTVYDLATGTPVLGPLNTPFYGADVAINADGSLVALAGGPAGDLAVYRVADGQLIGTLAGLGPLPDESPSASPVNTAAVDFGPDGRIYLGSARGPIRVVDPATLAVVSTFDAPLLSSNNQLIATDTVLLAAGDEAIAGVDLTTSAPRWSSVPRARGPTPAALIALSEPHRPVLLPTHVRHGADRTSTASAASTNMTWPPANRPGVVLDPQLGTVGDVAVSADGRELVTFSHNSPGHLPLAARRHRARHHPTRPGRGDRRSLRPDRQPDARQPDRRDARHCSSEYRTGGDDVYILDPAPSGSSTRSTASAKRRGRDRPVCWLRIFDDRTGGFYDLDADARVEGPTSSCSTDSSPSTPSVRRHGRYLRRLRRWAHVRTLDTAPTAGSDRRSRLAGAIGSISATADGSRVIVTHLDRTAIWRMTLHDGTTGEPDRRQYSTSTPPRSGPDGTLVAANTVGDITEYDLDTLSRSAASPALAGSSPGCSSATTASSSSPCRMIGPCPSTTSPPASASATRSRSSCSTRKPPHSAPTARPSPSATATASPSGTSTPNTSQAAACRLAGRNLTPTEWDTHLAALGDYRPTCPQYG